MIRRPSGLIGFGGTARCTVPVKVSVPRSAKVACPVSGTSNLLGGPAGGVTGAAAAPAAPASAPTAAVTAVTAQRAILDTDMLNPRW
ncbi:hypothetical protein GCM10009662_25550 [Catellatospora coxensis]|uniref:Uncharacterized protein n=1 Tax=Catellatospora coxensis TaxID=310354 RepID=A0A8J3KZ83_9ACTN|nr:hypothetical protein Cco03nite_81680 [Catellatospora coxensis]